MKVLQQLQLMKPFTDTPITNEFKLEYDEIILTNVKQKIIDRDPLSDRYICIHASFGQGNRGWYPDRYVGLIDKLHQEFVEKPSK